MTREKPLRREEMLEVFSILDAGTRESSKERNETLNTSRIFENNK